NTIFNSMSESLAEGNRIEMRGFGTFSVKHYPGYVGRNPRTGQEVKVAPKRAIQFRVGKELRERVNDGFDAEEAFNEEDDD
ncbi:MAG: HU family DNA-binding protein, partial [Myxococcota bacterium]